MADWNNPFGDDEAFAADCAALTVQALEAGKNPKVPPVRLRLDKCSYDREEPPQTGEGEQSPAPPLW